MLKIFTSTIVLILYLNPVLSLAAEEIEVSVVEVKRLSADTAMIIAKGAIAACRKKGIQVGVTVSDRNGIPLVKMRDTIAAPLTLIISEKKAYTAANFNASTRDLKRLIDSPLGRQDNLFFNPGGIPIQAAGALLGAVGVSGAPSGMTDEECAQAGINKVKVDLEMAM